jgi:hypothetical protein
LYEGMDGFQLVPIQYKSVIVSFTTVTNIRVLQKAENCSEQVSNYQLLKKDSAVWCQSVCYTYLASTVSCMVERRLR